MPRVAVVVPIFNGMTFLPQFFASLAGALPPGSEVVLVDDGSTEPVWETVPDLTSASCVVRLRNDRNTGYARTVNRGLAATTAEIVVILNSDLVLQPTTITELTALIDRERSVGIVGSRLLFPTTNRVQHVGMAFGHHSQRHVFYDAMSTHPLTRRTRRVQITTGAITAMTRRTLDRIGPLDERYFNNNEDIDHCLKANRAGLRNFVCGRSEAHHWESQSGPARFARIEATEGLFWSTWGGSVETDLSRYVDEALDHLLDGSPDLLDADLQVLDLTRGLDAEIVVPELRRRWPALRYTDSHRQMSSPEGPLRLSLLLPHWTVLEPRPFLYLVDRHRDLEENALWFQTRRGIVREEVVVDLNAVALTTSAAYGRSAGDQYTT